MSDVVQERTDFPRGAYPHHHSVGDKGFTDSLEGARGG